MTHELLADMLGVRRTSIMMAATCRTRARSNQARGCVRIINRTLLERRACECYDIIQAAYRDAGLG